MVIFVPHPFYTQRKTPSPSTQLIGPMVGLIASEKSILHPLETKPQFLGPAVCSRCTGSAILAPCFVFTSVEWTWNYKWRFLYITFKTFCTLKCKESMFALDLLGFVTLICQ